MCVVYRKIAMLCNFFCCQRVIFFCQCMYFFATRGLSSLGLGLLWLSLWALPFPAKEKVAMWLIQIAAAWFWPVAILEWPPGRTEWPAL